MFIKAASFDIWLTLLKSDPEFKQKRNEHLRSTFAPQYSFADFDRLLRKYDKEADLLSEESGEDYDFVRRLKLMFEAEGILFEEADSRFTACLKRQEELAREHPPVAYHADAPKLLRELARHMPVAVVSNTGMLPGTLMRDLLAHAGYEHVFSATIFSDEVGASKPSPAIFQEAVRQLGAAPEEIVHLGDNPVADGEGARLAGMKHILVNQPSALDISQALRAMLEATA